MLRSAYILALAAGLVLSACTTVPEGPDSTTQYPDPDVENPGVIIIAQPQEAPPPPPAIPAPPPPPAEAPPEPVIEMPSGFEHLTDWQSADLRPALSAFSRGCQSWQKADAQSWLNPKLPEYGRYADWASVCVQAIALSETTPRSYQIRELFEREFSPVDLSAVTKDEGLLTGYYEPEIDVRLTPDSTYREPILAKPKSKSVQNLPRADLSAASSRVIAYGKPIDVFFMQVQGSGRIRFKDGRSIRAAYGGNNGKPYKSIGRVLIERGELTRDQASKQSIEEWMTRNGPKAARALMNENPRYIFFTEQAILDGEGPRGSMRVPLTEMASIAVDYRYHPYGTLIWLETTLPRFGGDYKGAPAQLLVAAQDSGSAIKGPLRGDLFFGAGKTAGDKAGVMKHPVRWTILLPKAIAPKPASTS